MTACLAWLTQSICVAPMTCVSGHGFIASNVANSPIGGSTMCHSAGTQMIRTRWIQVVWVGLALPACNNNKLDADGDGFTELTNDCDDNDPNIHPDAIEVCYNGIDDNCNGLEDEEGATSGRVWYVDLDGDGYGNETVTVMACEQPENYASNKWDCNENDPNIHPDAEEICDTLDNDCDGLIDYADPDVKVLTWYLDADEDDFGQTSVTKEACEKPAGYVAADGDCDDADPDVQMLTFFADSDGDGFGDPEDTVDACEPPTDYVDDDTDCDDT
ncbi:MAG TPA: hypothetical protein DFR83_15695, partial [Deltaproteobacteria bacterium]|nr:hypothetical protein [Deltaproteobacteria bacterium]